MKKQRTRAFKRRMFTFYGLLILSVVALISAVVAIEINNKAEFFKNDSSDSIAGSGSEQKLISNLPEDDSFDVYFYASKFDEATKKDGKVIPGKIEFKLALYNKTTKKQIKNLSIELNVGTDWAYGHDIFAAATKSANIIDTKEASNLLKNDYSDLNINTFNQVFPTRQLLVIKIKAPTAKLKIEWDEVSETTGLTKSYRKIYTYSYEDYFIDKLSVGGLSKY